MCAEILALLSEGKTLSQYDLAKRLGGDLQSMMPSNEAIVDVEEGHIKGFPVIE